MIYHKAGQQGVELQTVPTIVEQDSWRYHSTRHNQSIDDAHSMVCCVFVCNVWKTGGVFAGAAGNGVQCGELTNLDVYSLAIFKQQNATTGRDGRCVATDPTNPSCQIMGNYTLRLNRVNSRPVAPGMAEKCPTTLPGCTAGWDCPTQPADC